MNVDNIVATILAGGTVGGLITFLGNIVMFKMQRKATKEDRRYNDNEWKEKINKRLEDDERKTKDVVNKIDEIKNGQEIILYDRIVYLCRSYIKNGEIAFEDRAILHKMYSAYKRLSGIDEEKDLSILIKEIDELKTKN